VTGYQKFIIQRLTTYMLLLTGVFGQLVAHHGDESDIREIKYDVTSNGKRQK